MFAPSEKAFCSELKGEGKESDSTQSRNGIVVIESETVLFKFYFKSKAMLWIFLFVVSDLRSDHIHIQGILCLRVKFFYVLDTFCVVALSNDLLHVKLSCTCKILLKNKNGQE